MYRIGKIMQGKYHTISECSFYNALKPDIKLGIVEHIKECSIEQQQILYYGNRKNHKLLDASIKRNKRHCYGIKLSHIRNEKKFSTTRD